MYTINCNKLSQNYVGKFFFLLILVKIMREVGMASSGHFSIWELFFLVKTFI